VVIYYYNQQLELKDFEINKNMEDLNIYNLE
jgi:hypothetical protein